MAIAKAEITAEIREVVLRDKPQQLLDISAKGTVPVLLLPDGKVIDESRDIMDWALSCHSPDNWKKNELSDEINDLIEWNDSDFKYFLDRYKYADRYPEQTEEYYREKAEHFLSELETRLSHHAFFCDEKYTLADMAIFPFIRQFSAVDTVWFQSSKFQNLNHWLKKRLQSELFISVMKKYPAWQVGQTEWM
jgi:glutathione S-transferase